MNFITTTAKYLKTHKKSKHEVVKYPCDQFDYAATTTTGLKKHKESKHEGIRYPGDQCGSFGSRAGIGRSENI